MKTLVVLGTRPEAIKLWPVIEQLRASGAEAIVCSTGQHRDLLSGILPALGIRPFVDLDLMSQGERPDALVSRVAARVTDIIVETRPDWVIVQGDTSTALGASLAASATATRLAHVEAGLRTFNLAAPWPEEGNRREIARLADQHFAPTPRAAANLEAEGVANSQILITGNTAIDALHLMLARLDAEPALRDEAETEMGLAPSQKRLVVVTAHRRENIAGFGALAANLAELGRRGDVDIIIPVHPSAGAQSLGDALRGRASVGLRPSLSYQACVSLLQRASLLITDSGGLQEEAPSLGLPVLVTRIATERPEALECGAAELVSAETLVDVANRLLDDPVAYDAMAQVRHPFGDGRAAERIVRHLQGMHVSQPERERV